MDIDLKSWAKSLGSLLGTLRRILASLRTMTGPKGPGKGPRIG
ncbi:MAG TPA: hypothetical protein VME43_27280 [Bryobacteraceae bacterium]|nr:hypothetical protein [Bryobacteraceae bacterium]